MFAVSKGSVEKDEVPVCRWLSYLKPVGNLWSMVGMASRRPLSSI